MAETQFRPRPIRRGSPEAARLKVGKLNATQRSLAYLRKQEWTVDVAEKFVTHGGTKAQEIYIDELVRQRAALIHRLRTLPADVIEAQTLADLFLARLKEPKPPAGIGGYRKDLFGFIDILGFRGDETLAAQTTSFQQVAPHILQFRRDEELRTIILDWIASANRSFVLHGWRCMEVLRKDGKGTKAEWQLTERWIEPADLPVDDF